MKAKLSLIVALIASAAIILLAGCQSAPTQVEQGLFSIQTNVVQQTVTKTNWVTVTNFTVTQLTNYVQDKIVSIVPVTNVTTVPVPLFVTVTNTVEQYTFKPGAGAAAVTGAGTAIGSFAGVGPIVGGVLGAFFGIYGIFRSSREKGLRSAAEATAECLAQVIETGRELMKTTPQGTALADQWKTWMVTHQAEQGVIENVTGIVANVVDNDSAKLAAQKLLALMQETKGTTK